MLWSIEYYAQYFDVDTKQVLDRCWAAIFPRTPFLDVLGGNPDLYGINPYPSIASPLSLFPIFSVHNDPPIFAFRSMLGFKRLTHGRTILDLLDNNNNSLLFIHSSRLPSGIAFRY